MTAVTSVCDESGTLGRKWVGGGLRLIGQGALLPAAHAGDIVAIYGMVVCDGARWAFVHEIRSQRAATDAIVRGAHPSKIAKGEAANVRGAKLGQPPGNLTLRLVLQFCSFHRNLH